MTAVPLIAIEQGKPHCFFLAGRKGIPCLGRIFLEGIACFQRYTRLNTERIIAVYIHTVLVTACSACGITVKHCTGVIAHGISIPVISESKEIVPISPAANAVVAGSTEKVVTAAMNQGPQPFLNNLGNFIHYLLLFVCEFLY